MNARQNLNINPNNLKIDEAPASRAGRNKGPGGLTDSTRETADTLPVQQKITSPSAACEGGAQLLADALRDALGSRDEALGLGLAAAEEGWQLGGVGELGECGLRGGRRKHAHLGYAYVQLEM